MRTKFQMIFIIGALGSSLYIYKQIKYKNKTALEIYIWLLKLVAYYYYRKIDSL